jgi:hypothetical protein
MNAADKVIGKYKNMKEKQKKQTGKKDKSHVNLEPQVGSQSSVGGPSPTSDASGEHDVKL